MFLHQELGQIKKSAFENHKGLEEVRNEVTKATSDVAKHLATIEWEHIQVIKVGNHCADKLL